MYPASEKCTHKEKKQNAKFFSQKFTQNNMGQTLFCCGNLWKNFEVSPPSWIWLPQKICTQQSKETSFPKNPWLSFTAVISFPRTWQRQYPSGHPPSASRDTSLWAGGVCLTARAELKQIDDFHVIRCCVCCFSQPTIVARNIGCFESCVLRYGCGLFLGFWVSTFGWAGFWLSFHILCRHSFWISAIFNINDLYLLRGHFYTL